MKVTMIGTGYVGLVSGVCFAEIGHDVTCIDIREDIIEMLKGGKSPIYEPGLSELIGKNYKAKRIGFSTSYDSVKDAKVVFLGVGTPSSDDGSADLSYLKAAAVSVAKEISDNSIVVIKSTVPVGTHKMIKQLISENTDNKFYIVNNPEFLKEGAAIDDFLKPDRVVIGCDNEYASEAMKELYSPLMLQGHPIYIMSNLSAEMTKYASNSLLATKISFINDIAKLCDLVGADIEEVRKGMASDKRIGPHFIYAGPGYGGSCFPKDVKALIHTGKEYNLDMKVIRAVEEVNDDQKLYMASKVKKHYGDLTGKVFAFWGTSFKPSTDDIRESPSIYMAKELISHGATVNFFDPEGDENFFELMEKDSLTKGKTQKHKNKYDCLNGADALILMTEWREFRAPDFSEIKSRLNDSVIFDSRNIYPIQKVLEEGFTYYAIGKRVK